MVGIRESRRLLAAGAVLLAVLTVAGCGDFDGIETPTPSPQPSTEDDEPSMPSDLHFGMATAGCRVAFTPPSRADGENGLTVEGYSYTRCEKPPRSYRMTLALELRSDDGVWKNVGKERDSARIRQGEVKETWVSKDKGAYGDLEEPGTYRMRYEADLRMADGTRHHMGPHYSRLLRIKDDGSW
jgi:hypothetical protein